MTDECVPFSSITTYGSDSFGQKAFDAFRRAILTFPFASTRLSEQTETLPNDVLFGSECNTTVSQLVGLIDRVTYIGTCELFLPPEVISFRSCIQNSNEDLPAYFVHEDCITGALLERQLVSLQPSRWKEGVRVVFIGLLKDGLEIYSAQAEDGALLMPIRKAKMLIRCLEFSYRDSGDDWTTSLGYGSVEEVATEIERLCSLQESQFVSKFYTKHNLNLFLAVLREGFLPSSFWPSISCCRSTMGCSACTSQS